jgi:hypothetical protein
MNIFATSFNMYEEKVEIQNITCNVLMKGKLKMYKATN